MNDPINIMQEASDNWCEYFDGFDSSRSHFVAIKKGLEDAGFAIVPVEPTFDMMTDGVVAFSVKEEDGDKVVEMYKAMIKAAQEGE